MRKTMLLPIIKLLFALWCVVFFALVICRVQYKPIVIHSEKIMNVISMLLWFPKEMAKASALFPFVILRFQTHEMNHIRVYHETIHHYQIIETAWLILIYAQLEYRYARYVLGYDHMQAYLYQTIEQEAYLNQENLNYVVWRPIFGFWKYMKQKVPFTLVNFRVVLQ